MAQQDQASMIFRQNLERFFWSGMALQQSLVVMWFEAARPFVEMMCPPSRAARAIDRIETSHFGEHVVIYLRPI